MDLDEWYEQAGRAAYEKAFLKHAPADAPRWDDIGEAAKESWRDIARAVLGEGKIEIRPSAELAEAETREENERLKTIAADWSRLARNWQWSAQQVRDERNQLRAEVDKQQSINTGLRRAYEHACEQRDKYMRRTVEWREKYTNAGVEAELKIQRGWPDFRDTVAELDELRKRMTELEDDSAKLAAFEAAGVDNWEGYELALEMMEENDDGDGN